MLFPLWEVSVVSWGLGSLRKGDPDGEHKCFGYEGAGEILGKRE